MPCCRPIRVELDALAADLLIHVTSFFRDPAVFDALAQSFIPDLVQAHPRWPAIARLGCRLQHGRGSLLAGHAVPGADRAAGRPIKLQVFASDVDAEAIAAARDGAYPAAIEACVSPARLARFFVREDAGWRAAADLRATIVFTVQDILADPPFSRLDMVSCRNLLIYLRPDAQARVLDGVPLRVARWRHPRCSVAPRVRLGPRPVRGAGNGRAHLSPDRTRHAGQAGQPASRRQGLALVRPGEERRHGGRRQCRPGCMRPAALADLGRRLVMEAYAPASVLVDTANTVLFSLGPTDRYLRLPPGHATHDLLAMARPGLRGKLRAALQAARDGKVKVLDRA